ncbi:MAG: helix-turn-helix transcriptional regulator, partial [Lachnospiraceae bacterium]|nr:helix-turn-helix transcriptional regulator [Lachnospiraceae bacterium]
MQKHLSENFSIENLAELLGVSSSYFNRLFVKET